MHRTEKTESNVTSETAYAEGCLMDDWAGVDCRAQQHSASDNENHTENRAQIKRGSTSKYRVGDRVWFDPGRSMPLEGPYLIASVTSNGRYTLCHDDAGNNEAGNNEAVNNGEQVDESQLRRA